MSSLLRTDKEITEIYRHHVDTVWRVCYSFMKNAADTEDIVQETFLKLISCDAKFQSSEHEKAWLIVTSANLCKDAIKRAYRKDMPLEGIVELAAPEKDHSSLMDAIMALPVEYKTVCYLHYYEGYSTKEIAGILHCPHPTIRTRLARARKKLKSMLGGEFDEK